MPDTHPQDVVRPVHRKEQPECAQRVAFSAMILDSERKDESLDEASLSFRSFTVDASFAAASRRARLSILLTSLFSWLAGAVVGTLIYSSYKVEAVGHHT